MLKKIAVAMLFAITFAVGVGTAQARTTVPHRLCPIAACV